MKGIWKCRLKEEKGPTGVPKGRRRHSKALGHSLTRAVCSTIFMRTVFAEWCWSLPRATAYQAWLYTGITWGATQWIRITERGPRNVQLKKCHRWCCRASTQGCRTALPGRCGMDHWRPTHLQFDLGHHRSYWIKNPKDLDSAKSNAHE